MSREREETGAWPHSKAGAGTADPSSEARIMAHLVASYPTAEASAAVAETLVEAGVAALEIQFPFSDPTADGPSIQEACGAALRSGFQTRDGFALVSELSRRHKTPIYIMTYASIPYAVGVERFVRQAAEAGAAGLIVPDLPPDSDEGLYAAGRQSGVEVVPVLVAGAREERIRAAEAVSPAHVYCALRAGTTGTKTQIGPENLAFLSRVKESGAAVMAGFGIQGRDQVEMLSGKVDLIVVGSALVRIVAKHAGSTPGAASAEGKAGAYEGLRAELSTFAKELVYGRRPDAVDRG